MTPPSKMFKAPVLPRMERDLQPLYDQAALDAALALWPRDCRLCAKFTTQSGGCTSTVQCVDSDQYKATAPRQYWVSGPNTAVTGLGRNRSNDD